MPRTQQNGLEQALDQYNTYIKAKNKRLRQHVVRNTLSQKTAEGPTRLLVFTSATGNYWGCDIERLIEPLCDTSAIDNLMINRIDRTGRPISATWEDLTDEPEQTLLAYQLTDLNAATSTPTYSPLEQASSKLTAHDGQVIIVDSRSPHRSISNAMDAIANLTVDDSTLDTSWLTAPARLHKDSVPETGQRQLDTFIEPAAP